MTSIFRGTRPLDYLLAAGMTALGVVLMVSNIQGSDGSGTRIDSHSWALIPLYALVTLPILWRRVNLWAVLGVTAATSVAHVFAFGWEVRCGAGLPLAFALAYAVGRFMSRRQSVGGLAAVIALQFLVLVRDSAAGLGVLPFTAVISAAFWGVGLYLQRRQARVTTGSAAVPTVEPVKTFA